ncbi:MAG: HAMP domain-containing sensor histidine kinase, partial [Bacteroidota bacterium]
MARPLILFYILVFYVLLQFSWWAYLLIDLNEEIFVQRIELIEATNNNPQEIAAEKIKHNKELHKRWAMVLGEGSVFLALLLVGIYITNHAFRREAELARQQRNFLLSVTHEFKSPLAAVKLNLQTMQKRQLEETQRQEILRKAILETERIDILVEKTLMAARLEDKNYDLQPEQINLSEHVHRIISDHIDRRDPVHNIQHHIAPSIYIYGDPVAFTSMLVNLVENAEKYSPPETTIEVRLTRTEKSALLTVADHGIGISDKERGKVFQKFYRTGNEDTRRTKGTGLGLYIVKHVVNMHKGSITVNKNHPSGTVFEMTFPLAA